MRVDEIFKPLVEIEHTQNVWDERAGEVVVNVNVSAFDKNWEASNPSDYVGPGGTGAAIKDRYPRFIEFMKSAKSYEVPTVRVSKQGGVQFGNGRHRYAVMRDQGHKALPISMDRESAKNAYKNNLIMREHKIEEDIPDPKKLLQGLKAFIYISTRYDVRTALKKLKEMGFNPAQIARIQSAYNRVEGAKIARASA